MIRRSMAYLGMAPLGSLIAGTAAKYIGAPNTLLFGGLCYTAAALIFARTLGNTLGVTALGALVNYGVILFASEHGTRLTTSEIHDLLSSIGNILGGGADPSLRAGLDAALRLTFWGMLGFAALSAALAIMVPVRELDTLSGGTQAAPSPQPDAEVQLGE